MSIRAVCKYGVWFEVKHFIFYEDGKMGLFCDAKNCPNKKEDCGNTYNLARLFKLVEQLEEKGGENL